MNSALETKFCIKTNYNNYIKIIIDFSLYIKRKCYSKYYPIFTYRLRIIKNMKLIENKYDHLENIIKHMEKKYIKRYYQIYREKILNRKIVSMINGIRKKTPKKIETDKTNKKNYIITVNLKNCITNKIKNINRNIFIYKKQKNTVIKKKKPSKLLLKIINNKISKLQIINNSLLVKSFNIWKNNNIGFDGVTDAQKNESNRNSDHGERSSKTKHIKVIHRKSGSSQNNSMMKKEKNQVNKTSSFKKMNISSVKVMEPCSLEVNFKEDINNNFLNKLSTLIKKIEIKNLLCNYFKEWLKNK